MATGGDCRQGGPRANQSAGRGATPSHHAEVDRAAPLLDRKARGAWATPHWLVEHLLDVVLDPVLATRTTAAGPAGARPGLRRRSLPRRRRGPHRPALRCELGPRRSGAGRDRARRRDRGRGQAAARPGGHRPARRCPADGPPRSGSTSSSATRRSSTSWPARPRAGAARITEVARTPMPPSSSWRSPSAWPGPTAGASGSSCRSRLLASRDAADVRRGAVRCSVASTGCGGRPATRSSTPRSTRWPPPSCSASASDRCGGWRGEACQSSGPGRRHRTRPAGRRGRTCWPTPPGSPCVEARTDGVLGRLGHRHRRLPRPVLRPDPVRRDDGLRGRAPRHRPACSTLVARRGASGRPASAVAGTCARASTWPPSARPTHGWRPGPRLAGCPRCCWPPRPPSWRRPSTSRARGCRACRWCRWSPATPGDLWPIGAVLCSPVASAWAAATYLGAGLGAATIKLSAAQTLTIPRPAGPLDEAVELLRAGDLDGAGVASTRAYGVRGDAADELLGWWRTRVSAARRRSARVSGC